MAVHDSELWINDDEFTNHSVMFLRLCLGCFLKPRRTEPMALRDWGFGVDLYMACLEGVNQMKNVVLSRIGEQCPYRWGNACELYHSSPKATPPASRGTSTTATYTPSGVSLWHGISKWGFLALYWSQVDQLLCMAGNLPWADCPLFLQSVTGKIKSYLCYLASSWTPTAAEQRGSKITVQIQSSWFKMFLASTRVPSSTYNGTQRNLAQVCL